MNAIEIINTIRQAGGSVQSIDGSLRILAPAGTITDEDRLVLTEAKEDLVRLLAPADPEREAIQWVESLSDEQAETVVDQARREWREIVEKSPHDCLDRFGDPVFSNAERRFYRNLGAKRARRRRRGKTVCDDVEEIVEETFGKAGIEIEARFSRTPETDHWDSISNEDQEYLTGPRNWPEPCPWCSGRLRHNPACVHWTWQPRLNFGKHKGKLLPDVPAGYLTWLLANASSLNSAVKLPTGNVAKSKYEPVIVAHLSNSNFSGYSSTGWYLLADAADGVACWAISYLNGVETPTIEIEDTDFNTLGIQMRGYIDYGVAQVDSNGRVHAKGSA